MQNGRAFLVVPSALRADFQEFAFKSLAWNSRGSVCILTDAAKVEHKSDVKEGVTRALLNSLASSAVDQADSLLIHREAKCSHKTLEDWWRDEGPGQGRCKVLAPKAIKRALTDQWEAEGSHWRVYAGREIGKFDGTAIPLNEWINQFTRLGYPAVGPKLAGRLRVVRPVEMQPQPFAPRSVDQLGQSQAHCYVRDSDEGGSWVDVQALLTHSHPVGSVKPVLWDSGAKTLTFPQVHVDQFVLYEDGLWSGHEASRRLEAMQTMPPEAQVVMKFGIVTDFGLLVCRHAIRSLGLVKTVAIDASSSELIQLLRSDVPERLRNGNDLSREEYFKALHDYTNPLAFEGNSEWSESERQFCREAGSQLVKQWLQKETGVSPSPEKVARFALGGGGFASTTLFARSVPKVCLPLLWLNGQVVIEDNLVEWKPLFVDARRISDPTLLYVGT